MARLKIQYAKLGRELYGELVVSGEAPRLAKGFIPQWVTEQIRRAFMQAALVDSALQSDMPVYLALMLADRDKLERECEHHMQQTIKAILSAANAAEALSKERVTA